MERTNAVFRPDTSGLTNCEQSLATWAPCSELQHVAPTAMPFLRKVQRIALYVRVSDDNGQYGPHIFFGVHAPVNILQPPSLRTLEDTSPPHFSPAAARDANPDLKLFKWNKFLLVRVDNNQQVPKPVFSVQHILQAITPM
jgi:hypothetical protein